MDRKIALLIGAWVVNIASLGRLLLQAAGARALCLDFHFAARAFVFAHEVVDKAYRIGRCCAQQQSS